MTRRLILMRHAKSDWTHDLEDHERPLNTRGQLAAETMGQWLRLNEYLPDEVFSSTSERTKETFECLALDAKPNYLSRLYLAGPETMMNTLHRASGHTVLLIGHNPGIADFAHQAVARVPNHAKFSSYPTLATLIVDFGIKDWKDLQPGSGIVADFIVPKDLQ